MNYRHAFHAGNHADVFKHLTLTRLIALMSRKEQPFAYLDTHAGIGLYDLQGDQASRTGEYLEGIARLWDQPDLPALTADYMKVLHDMNPDGQLRYYPGSPELARRLTRPHSAHRAAPARGSSRRRDATRPCRPAPECRPPASRSWRGPSASPAQRRARPSACRGWRRSPGCPTACRLHLAARATG